MSVYVVHCMLVSSRGFYLGRDSVKRSSTNIYSVDWSLKCNQCNEYELTKGFNLMRNCECDSLVMVVDCRTCTYRMEGIYSDEWFAIRERVCTQYGFTYWVLIYSFRFGRKAIVLHCCSSVPPSNVLQLVYRNWREKGMRTQRETTLNPCPHENTNWRQPLKP